MVSLSNHRLSANGFGETGHLGPIASHHGFLLFSAPAFDLLFGGQGFLAGWEVLGKNQFQRSALERVATGYRTRMVLLNTLFDVVSVAGVVAAVGATEDVNPKGH